MGTLRKVGVYGTGHFGYALLHHLEHKAGSQIELKAYDRNPQIRASLATQRQHPLYESGSLLAEHVRIVDSVAELMDGLEILILAVTSISMREVSARIAAEPWTSPLTIVNTAKALDYQTGRRLSEIVAEVISNPSQPVTYAALAGGTIAGELLSQNPLGMTIACLDRGKLGELKWLFGSPNMWVEVTTDLVGVEHAGAFKNVIAICAGMVRGLGFSYGAETHLISRMAQEAEKFCIGCLGAAPETFSIGSQCWGSDLWMSCTGSSRNRALGELLGEGQSLQEANEQMAAQQKTVEGVQTLRALDAILQDYPDELRLIRTAHQVILHNAPPKTLVDALMQDDA